MVTVAWKAGIARKQVVFKEGGGLVPLSQGFNCIYANGKAERTHNCSAEEG